MSKNTIILGDVHGSVDALINTLMAAGVVSRDGTKNDDWRVIQVGDLCNMAPHGREDNHRFVNNQNDLECLEFGLEVIDDLLVGNHEVFYTHNLDIGRWQGMALSNADLQDGLVRKMGYAAQDGQFKAAVEIDGMLVTHAGLNGYYYDMFADRGHTTAAAIADALNYDLVSLAIHSHDDVVAPDAIVRPDGIFWNRPGYYSDKSGEYIYGTWDDGISTPFVQVCGHTPSHSHPHFYEKYNGWIIDTGAYANEDFPTVGALIKRDGEDEYGSKIWQELK